MRFFGQGRVPISTSPNFVPVALAGRPTRGANEEPERGPRHSCPPRGPDRVQDVPLGVRAFLDRCTQQGHDYRSSH